MRYLTREGSLDAAVVSFVAVAFPLVSVALKHKETGSTNNLNG